MNAEKKLNKGIHQTPSSWLKYRIMHLALETLLLTLVMFAVCALPFFFRGARSSSGPLFLLGTGALFGICVFDLLPDIYEMGGTTSLVLAFGVGTAYSLVHVIHMLRHRNRAFSQGEPTSEEARERFVVARTHAHSLPIFFFSIVGHCFASGILLSVSRSLSEKLAGAVFLALLGHKGYEAVVFVSLLVSHRLSRRGTLAAITIYCLALPMGVLTAYAFSDSIGHTFALQISSLAVGTLLGCLIFDFTLPSVTILKNAPLRSAWLIAGFLCSRLTEHI